MAWSQSPELIAYQTWARENGCVFPKLKVVNFDNFWGMGGWIDDPLQAGEDVVSVPFKLLINYENAMQTDPFSRIYEDIKDFDPLWVIYLFLVHERANPKSFWRPYLDIIPSRYSTPLWWDEQCFEELKGTNLHDLAAQVMASVKRIYADMVPKLNEKHPDIFKLDIFSWDSFLWAYSAFWSRCFAINKGGKIIPSVAPVCDALNHKKKSTVKFHFVEETNTFHYQATESMQGSGQIFVNYKTNCKTSEALLLNYDITIEKDSCWVQLGLKSGDEALDTKIKLLAENNIPQRHYLKAAHLPPTLVQAVRICLLDESDIYFYGSACSCTKMISVCNEVKVLKTLQDMVSERKNKFENTVAFDKQRYLELTGEQHSNTYSLGANKIVTEQQFHRSLALWYRISQREILDSTLAILRKELDNIIPSTPLCSDTAFTAFPEQPAMKSNNLQLGSSLTPVAKKELSIGASILSFNLACSDKLITHKLIAKTKIGKAVAWAQGRKKLANKEIDWEDMAIYLYLINEKYNPQSYWSPMIKALPSHFDNTLCWTDEELGELEETDLLEQTLQLKAQLEADFTTVMPVLAEKFPDIFTHDRFSLANFLWAFTLYETRRIATNDGVALVPLPHTLTHHPYITTRKVFDVSNNSFELQASQVIPKHGIVYDSLGKLPNQQLLLIYGICSHENPYDTLEIEFNIPEHDPLLAEKLALLGKLKLSLSNKLGMEQLSPFMLHTFRICIALDTMELTRLDVDLLSTPFTPQQDRETVVLKSLMATLQSLASDEEGLVADDVPPRALLAMQYRASQNCILRRNIEFIKQNII